MKKIVLMGLMTLTASLGPASAGEVCVATHLANCPNPASIPVPGVHGTATLYGTSGFVQGGTDDGTLNLGSTGYATNVNNVTAPGFAVSVDGTTVAWGNLSYAIIGRADIAACVAGPCLGKTGFDHAGNFFMYFLWVNGTRHCNGWWFDPISNLNGLVVMRPC